MAAAVTHVEEAEVHGSMNGCCVDKKYGKGCNESTCMTLPAGKTCGDCAHVRRCTAIFGMTETDTSCSFFSATVQVGRRHNVGAIMKKMPCLFVREFHDKRSFTITREVTPGCEWVIAGEGVGSRKWDGTACAIIEGVLYKRYDAKRDRKTGEYKPPPAGAIPCDEPDEVTGHWPHWIRVGDEPESQWIRRAYEVSKAAGHDLSDGTYEACGQKIGGNEEIEDHVLYRHGAHEIICGRDFDTLKLVLEFQRIEGIVFAHPDGRFAKIRRADFGFSWPVKAST